MDFLSNAMPRSYDHVDPEEIASAVAGSNRGDEPTFDVLDPDDAESKRSMAQIDAAVTRVAAVGVGGTEGGGAGTWVHAEPSTAARRRSVDLRITGVLVRLPGIP